MVAALLLVVGFVATQTQHHVPAELAHEGATDQARDQHPRRRTVFSGSQPPVDTIDEGLVAFAASKGFGVVECRRLRTLWPDGEIHPADLRPDHMNIGSSSTPAFMVDVTARSLLVGRGGEVARVTFEPPEAAGQVVRCDEAEVDTTRNLEIAALDFEPGDHITVWSCGSDSSWMEDGRAVIEVSSLRSPCNIRIEHHRGWETHAVVITHGVEDEGSSITVDTRGVESEILTEADNKKAIESQFAIECRTLGTGDTGPWEDRLRDYLAMPDRLAFLTELIEGTTDCPPLTFP